MTRPAAAPYRRVQVAVLAAGFLLRIANYLQCRSLWLDEASLALSIATRSYGELVRPLDYNQAAPLLFLWAERLAVSLGGVNESALRLIPLIAGLATLVVVWRLAERLLPPPAAVLATALAAFSPALVVYSVEAKPYSIDGLSGAALLLLGVLVLERPDAVRRWTALVAAGAVALLGSTTAPLVLAGTGLGLVASTHVRRSTYGRRWLAAAALVWSALLVVLYLTFYKAADSEYLHEVWRTNFLIPGTPGLFDRTWSLLLEVVWSSLMGGITSWGLVGVRKVLVNGGTFVLLCCAALGIKHLARARGWPVTLLALGPAAALLGASALGLYPVSIRLVLFLLPALVLLTSAGVQDVTGSFGSHRGPQLLALIGCCFVVRAATYDVLSLIIPARSEDGRAVIRDLEQRHRSGEPVYLYARGLVVWAFYTTDWRSPDLERLAWYRTQGGPDGPAFENAPTRGRPVAADEGEGLTYHVPGRPEVIGLSTGARWLALAGFSQPGPDAGWAAREAARIREATTSTAWIFVTHTVDASHEDLLEQLARLGATVSYRRIEWGAAVFQVQFP